MWTKSDVKIIWNQMVRNKIKNKIQLGKEKVNNQKNEDQI
jgi:hypothetical protein